MAIKSSRSHGVADISQADMIKGMEALEITDAMMAENGLAGFALLLKLLAKIMVVQALVQFSSGMLLPKHGT